MIASKRLSIIENDDFTLDLEYNEEFAIVHLKNMPKLNKGTLGSLTIKIEDLYEFVTTIGFETLWAGVPEEDKATQKLAKKVGFEHCGAAQGIEVFQYGVS